MRVLVACEFSGVVREAFRARGHEAVSCDVLDTEIPGEHYRGKVEDILGEGWDLLIAFPPCTYLARSGARWWTIPARMERQKLALRFVRRLLASPVDRIALENPIGRISTAIRKPDQIIQPHQFGHPETKATCLWLKNLPHLKPTNLTLPLEDKITKHPQNKDRAKNRSRTYQGIAQAMADQWG